jgi:hypothetical protein
MKSRLVTLGTIFALFTSHLAFSETPLLAASNPIAWQLNDPFPVPTQVGRVYTITYTLTNKLPFRLAKALVITNNGSPQTEFSYDDQCTGKFLAPNASCTVAITLTPTINSKKFYQLTIGGYDNNLVPLPELTTISTGGGSQQGVQGVPTHPLSYQLQVGELGSYEFTFTNYADTAATHLVPVVTATGLTLSTPNVTCGTTITTLSPTTPSCTVSGAYTPTSANPASQTVTATLTFDGSSGSPASSSTFTTVSSSTSGSLRGSIIPNYYLPPVMAQTPSTYSLKFLFTNTTSGTVDFSGTHQGTVTCTSDNGTMGDCAAQVTYSAASDSNCGPTLPTTAACELDAVFTVPAATTPTTTYTVTASVPYTNGTGSPATVSTSGSVITTLATTRTITLKNQCTFPVWFSLNGAALAGYAPPSCPPGTSNGPSSTCFWNNPSPATGSYALAANTGEATVTIPAYNYGGTQWSGNMSASTLCSGTSCGQADCGNNGGTTSCLVGQGFSQPATQAEITMIASGADSYDVEVINGFHLPISMQPIYYQSGSTTIPATWNNYSCGTAGELTAQQGFGACNWSASTVAVPQPTSGTGLSSAYYWVPSTGTTPCDFTSATDQCSTSTTGEICGLSRDTSTDTFAAKCGKFLGYWSADQVCSYSGLPASVSTFFKCTQALPTAPSSPAPTDVYFPVNSTLYDLMRCKVPTGDVSPLFNSCYLTYSNSYTAGQINTCCGCVDWWNPSVTHATILANDDTQSCGTQVDPQWTTYVQPMIQWMKAACPSAYTFPFDDRTSTFGCSNNLPNEPNSVDYTITFCEGGNTGLPYGISPSDDGRNG